MEARGSFCFDRPESLCTRVLDPPGSPHAELWAQGTPCGRGRPPPRPLRLPQHRCPALLPQPQGFSDGPENGLSSTRPSSQPGCRVSAPGDRGQKIRAKIDKSSKVRRTLIPTISEAVSPARRKNRHIAASRPTSGTCKWWPGTGQVRQRCIARAR